MKTLTEKRFFEWHEDDVSVTLRNKSGSYGGGSEVFVIYRSNKIPDDYEETSCERCLDYGREMGFDHVCESQSRQHPCC